MNEDYKIPVEAMVNEELLLEVALFAATTRSKNVKLEGAEAIITRYVMNQLLDEMTVDELFLMDKQVIADMCNELLADYAMTSLAMLGLLDAGIDENGDIEYTTTELGKVVKEYSDKHPLNEQE